MILEVSEAFSVVDWVGIDYVADVGNLAGNTAGANSTAVPDWVDDSVALWIEQETKLMDSVWGPPGDKRGAVAFVHIPP